MVKEQKSEQIKAARLVKATANAVAKAAIEVAEADSDERGPIRAVEQEEARRSFQPLFVTHSP